MALIKCPECKKEISSRAKACPNCGYPINEKTEKEDARDSKIKLVAAKCPSCGSNIEVNPDNNKTRCEYCNSTIIVDDAIERLKVELTGEVEVKNMPKLKNLLKVADRAYDNKDYEKAVNSYRQVIAIDPDDWRAVFREGICTARVSTLAKFDLDKAIISSQNALQILIDNKVSEKEIAAFKIEMAHELIDLCVSFFNFAFDHYKKFWELNDSAKEMWNRLLVVRNGSKFVAEVLTNDKTIALCPKDENGESSLGWKVLALKEIVMCDVAICEPRKYKSGYNQYGNIYSNTAINSTLRTELVREYDKCVEIIKKEEPDYIPSPVINRSGKANGCYVATCVYGSYDCPQVWTLRRYRDFKLAKTWYGRLFIKFYYATSPKIVELFGGFKLFNSIIKPQLDIIVKRLNMEGYEETPYEDIDWNND